MDTNNLRQRYLLIGRDQHGDLEGQGVDDQTEALRIIADNDYPYMQWFELLDSYETAPELRLIDERQLELLVREFEADRWADERHENSLGVAG